MATGVLFQEELFCNNVSNLIGSGTPYNGSATADTPAAYTSESWTFSAVTGWPAATNTTVPTTGFRIANTNASYSSEIMAVIDISGDTCTVLRGIESTTTVAHPGGSTFVALATAGTLQNFKQATTAGVSEVTISNSSTETVIATYTPLGTEVEDGTTFEIIASGTMGILTTAIPTLQWTLYSGGSGSVGGAYTPGTLLCQMITGNTTTTNMCPPLATTTATTTSTTDLTAYWLSSHRWVPGTSFDVNGTIEWVSTTSAIGNLNFFWSVAGLNATTTPTVGMTGCVTSAAAVTGLTSTNGLFLTCKWSAAATSNVVTAPAPLIYRAA